jgi:GAF domain-containing protein
VGDGIAEFQPLYVDELRAVLSGTTGTWGALTLLREARSPHFTPAEVRFVASLAAALADGLRRAALLGDAVDGGDDDTGLLVLAADGTVEMANPAAGRWLDELGAGDRPGGHRASIWPTSAPASPAPPRM